MKNISIIGIGMGNPDTLTLEAAKEIAAAEVLIGAKRILAPFREKQDYINNAEKEGREVAFVEECHSKEVVRFIGQCDKENIAVLVSGDSGFYSGGTGVSRELKKLASEKPEKMQVKTYPGISSISYFGAKLGLPWEDAKILSLHGRKKNLVAAVCSHEKVFVLTDGKIADIAEVFVRAGMGNVEMYVGEKLSYPEERIERGRAKDFLGKKFSSMTVAFLVNHQTTSRIPSGLSEDNFIRGEIPMTKPEIRTVSIAKLQIGKKDILYDVGAGTGSVSIEMAMHAEDGMVFALEKREEAIQLLKANREKFGIANLQIIEGRAAQGLSVLPAPDAVFIGGSDGEMGEIIKQCLQKNPAVRFVINAVTLETLQEGLQLLERENVVCEVIQVSVSRAKKIGRYHRMEGANPIYIISGRRETL